MSYANVGKRWSPSSFPAYLATLPRPAWAKSVTIHHCAAPSLAQRPSGFLDQHLRNLEDFYKNTKGWSAGPHGFTDEDEIHGMSPFTAPGVHAVSFNRSSIGFEMLGNYDVEDPTTGRGLAVCHTTASAARSVLAWLDLPITEKTVLFHRDDPKTSKTCPGTRVKKDWFLDLVWTEHATVIVPKIATPPTNGAMAPVVNYIAEKLGKTYADVAKDFKREGKLYLYGGKWIEGAYYDAATQTTIASVSEIEETLGLI